MGGGSDRERLTDNEGGRGRWRVYERGGEKEGRGGREGGRKMQTYMHLGRQGEKYIQKDRHTYTEGENFHFPFRGCDLNP